MSTETKKGITIEDTEEIKNHILFSRGDCWTPARFYDYLLININRPYNEAQFIKNGFIKVDLLNIIKRFDGISYEYLSN